MSRLILRIHDFLDHHKPLAAVLLVLLLAAGIVLALQLHYEENIAEFLPQTAENAKQTAVYNALGDQGQITVIFRGKDQDEIMDAIDRFSEAATILPEGVNLQTRTDESDAMHAIETVGENIALYLTDEDYHRIDSLLANPDYIQQSLENVRRTLSMPLPQTVTEMITADPLGLFSPALQRLQALSPSSRFEMVDDYIFDADGNGYAFLTSPYSANDTRRNGELAKLLEKTMDSCRTENINISAVGAPLIAVTNATQIKKDSILAMGLAIILIAVVLLRTIGRKRNILWLGFTVAAGWLFAVAVIAIFKTEISIIVVGIGSVLVGIAVNYPLHYLEHLKEHPDRRETLHEMVEPLVTGNITTVAAFACLVFVKAEAMRDLGLFGSLMLVGTIGFTMVFLPLWAKGGRKTKNEKRKTKRVSRISTFNYQLSTSPLVFWTIVGVTVVLGYFSTKVEFDADLHNINYMTAQQQNDLELLTKGMDEVNLTYVVAEGKSLEEALENNDQLGLDGIAALAPSLERQKKALENWNKMLEKHPGLAVELEREARKAGFANNAFSPFTERLQRDYSAQPLSLDSKVGELAKNYILQTDSGYYVVNFERTTNYELRTKNGEQNVFAFTQAKVGSGLVNALNGDFNYILYICSFVVFFFLWVALGRLELALLAFLPMAMGWLWILGIMAIFGIKFNIVNIILATFIFGQGDDYTIFITEGLLYENATGLQRLKEYRRSVIISAILMFVGIGTLVIAKHPAMRSLGEVAVVGMGCVVLMACVVPPVIFRWLTTKNGERRRIPITLKRIAITWVPLLVFALFAMVIVTPLTLVYKALPGNRNKKRDAYHRFICATARLGARLMPYVKFKMENPNGEDFSHPAVIVANHSSHLDLLCMLMLHPKIVILTKDWVWRNPLYALIIRYAEYLPATDGYDRTMPRLRALVERGYSVMIFPEGTRSRDGHLGRFHKGAFALAEELGLPLLPICMHGNHDVWPKGESLITEGEITIHIGKRMSQVGSREMRHYMQEELEDMRSRLETDEYLHRIDRYKDIYKR